MAKQASLQETVGSAGQSRVKAQFEQLNWGVAENPYHDLGTDLWLMVRDDRRFDVGLLVGAQVKTSERRSATSKYFKEPKKDSNGKIIGWWYRESLPEDHFDYWIKHSIPHILVLHDLKSQTSYWVHITKEAIVRTKNGTKILVPKKQRIDPGRRSRLDDVAISQRGRQGTWEGSDWPDITTLGPNDRIRYALITPRLMAKRRTTRVANDENPCEAIAMVVQSRFHELDGSRELAEHLPGLEPPPFLSVGEALASTQWEWNLYGALHAYIHNGDPAAFEPLIESAQLNTAQRAAAIAVRAAALTERGRIDEALSLIADELPKAASLDPVNFAWLELHYARCLLEVGKHKKARELAINVQRIQTAVATDPTAMAIAASAAGILFRASRWSLPRPASVIHSTDTAAGWWRNQTIALGLETFLSDRFALWANEESGTPEHFVDTWQRLRTATLLSGFAGDHFSWRVEYAQLAQYVLQSHTTERLTTDTYAGLLTDLRLAGDVDSVKLCTQKLLLAGPEEAVRAACGSVNLLDSTHTTALADLELVSAAAEILDQPQVDAFIEQIITIMNDQQRYAKRVRLTFVIPAYVLPTLSALVAKASPAGRRTFLEYFLSLPPVTDQLFAHKCIPALKAVSQNDWTADDLDRLRGRTDDNWELEEAIVGIAATLDSTARQELLDTLREGSTRMLRNLQDFAEIPDDVAAAQITPLAASVRDEITSARNGTFFRNDSRALATLNIWHPAVAEWSPIYELLAERLIMPGNLVSLLALLRDASDQVPQNIREQLLPRLAALRDRVPVDLSPWREEGDHVSTVVRETMDALSPGSIVDADLWSLVGGDWEQRRAAARMIGRRNDVTRLDVLACLSHDEASAVRAAAAYWIARWLEHTESANRCNALLAELAQSPGTLVRRAITEALHFPGIREAAGDWAASIPRSDADDG